jgi:hypothetical protein
VLPASIGGVSGWRRAGRVEARHWTGEGKSRHGGERARPAATGSRFKGGGRSGGGSREHGRCVEEVGKSKGAWGSVAVWHQAAAAQPRRARAVHCRVTVEGGGVGDRWAWMRRGSDRQWLGVGRGSAASGAARR